MRSFAHHHVDTPHGSSHPPIALSVLLTALFVGALWVVYVLLVVTTPLRSEPFATYRAGTPFGTVTAIITVLLFVYLGVDLRRHRIEAHGGKRFQYATFGFAFVLLAALAVFLIRAM